MSERVFDDPRIAELLLTQWREPDDGSRVWGTYGITSTVYEAIVSIQGGLCSICGRKKPLVVDHCHQTGRVRGLICCACNSALGKVGDDPQRLRAKAARSVLAAEYLETMRGRSTHLPVLQRQDRSRPVRTARTTPPPVVRPAPAAESKPGRSSSETTPRGRARVACVVARPFDPIAIWPANDVCTFPLRYIERNTDFGRSRWSVWCPLKEVDTVPHGVYASHSDIEATWVQHRGIVHTGNVLAFRGLTPEQSVLFYLEAFARTLERVLSVAYATSHVMDLRDIVRSAIENRVPWNPHGEWHTQSRTVVPVSPDWYGDRDEIRAVRSPERLVALAAKYWRQTLDEWVLFAVSERAKGAA